MDTDDRNIATFIDSDGESMKVPLIVRDAIMAFMLQRNAKGRKTTCHFRKPYRGGWELRCVDADDKVLLAASRFLIQGQPQFTFHKTSGQIYPHCLRGKNNTCVVDADAFEVCSPHYAKAVLDAVRLHADVAGQVRVDEPHKYDDVMDYYREHPSKLLRRKVRIPAWGDAVVLEVVITPSGVIIGFLDRAINGIKRVPLASVSEVKEYVP